MLFDWLVAGQVTPSNPVQAVRGMRHPVSKGVMAVSSAEARELLDSIDEATVVGLRDRARVAVMAFTFARVSAFVDLKVEDYYPQNKNWKGILKKLLTCFSRETWGHSEKCGWWSDDGGLFGSHGDDLEKQFRRRPRPAANTQVHR